MENTRTRVPRIRDDKKSDKRIRWGDAILEGQTRRLSSVDAVCVHTRSLCAAAALLAADAQIRRRPRMSNASKKVRGSARGSSRALKAVQLAQGGEADKQSAVQKNGGSGGGPKKRGNTRPPCRHLYHGFVGDLGGRAAVTPTPGRSRSRSRSRSQSRSRSRQRSSSPSRSRSPPQRPRSGNAPRNGSKRRQNKEGVGSARQSRRQSPRRRSGRRSTQRSAMADNKRDVSPAPKSSGKPAQEKIHPRPALPYLHACNCFCFLFSVIVFCFLFSVSD